jgi:(3R)-3-hydroxyacyl-CoA dehydrogenase / 3a,7a,12a-trihydroxy-5b-cholest-24-enoyl-CoA hydratase / enoyl-CoA hydratase 2
MRFDGRTAIVTGAGNGLGRAHALLLAERGARVLVNDLGGSLDGGGKDQAAADQVCAQIRSAGGEAIPNYDSVEDGDRIVAAALAAFGRVDIVVNNAGILCDRSFHKMTEQEWDRVYRVHLLGAARVTRAAWPHLRAQRYGRVIFTSSAAGLFGNFGQANYAAMKLGLHGLCRALAVEGQSVGIGVNSISPSAASRLSDTILDAAATSALRPELVSPLVAYLAHEMCQTTGEIFAVGAGWIGQLRWQQSAGVNFGLGDLTPEAVAAKWQDIGDFAQATAPATFGEAARSMVDNVPALKAYFERQV